MSARILVVDDILPNVKLLEAKLSSEYYDVITASSGPEALEKIRRESPDLVLLDVMMPGMDGFEVCRIIKQDIALAHIPVVMVTALTDTQDKVRGLEVGADDFLSKPINDMALMARVRSLVRLKMSTDEWRVRENAATELGVINAAPSAMFESADQARVLAIEDRDYEQRKIRDSLSKEVARLAIVESGAEALNLIATEEFEVIIVSLDLASEDGLRLCSHFKSNERARTVPIVMIGSEEDMQRIAQGLEIGAYDYILRPVDRNELLARVRTQVRRKRFQRRLRSSYEISLSMALTDSLTGLHNRRYLEVHLSKLLEKNRENKKMLAVLMLDIDKFKHVNDTYGHTVGDQILKKFAERLKTNLRGFDLIARLGGEEFVVILPDITESRAHMVAERLRRYIADTPFDCTVPEGALPVTTSIGGVIVDHGDHGVEDVLNRADKCLYQAKEQGRNRTVFEGVGTLDPDEERGEQRRYLK